MSQLDYETLDYTIRIGSTPTFLYFDLYLYSAYAAHYVYLSQHCLRPTVFIVHQCLNIVQHWQSNTLLLEHGKHALVPCSLLSTQLFRRDNKVVTTLIWQLKNNLSWLNNVVHKVAAQQCWSCLLTTIEQFVHFYLCSCTASFNYSLL